MMHIGILLFIGYIIGAIPVGLWIARCGGIDNIMQHGSGNIGATNVGRLLGFKYFVLVLLADMMKAFLYIACLQTWVHESTIIMTAIALLIGNGFSIFLRGQGGKSIATTLGIVAALNYWVIIYCFCIWLPIFCLKRNVGISNVCCLVVFPVIMFYLLPAYLLLALVMTLWGIWRHQNNIRLFFASC